MDETSPPVAPPQAPPNDLKPLRFALDKIEYARLLAELTQANSAARGQLVRDCFYDTHNFALARHGFALRVRQIARKRSLALFLHDFIKEDVALPGSSPELTLLGPDWLAMLSGITQGAPLKPQAQTKTTRTTHAFDGATLLFETGFLNPDAQKLAFFEVEISAPTPRLPETALAIADRVKLRFQPESIGTRAIRLAGGPAPGLCKAAAGLKGDPCLDDAIFHLIRTCLTQFQANWPVFYEGDRIGAIHQMRVAMRRLRSALGLFNRVLPAAGFLPLRDEAKRIATVMGEARNWDVFTIALQTGPIRAFANEVGFVDLEAQCEAYRQAGYAEIEALLKHPQTTRFLLNAEALLAQRGWRAMLPSEALPRLAEPARIAATQGLERRHRKLRKHGKKLVRLSVEERHLVRIELKKIRYMADFFGGLFKPEGRVRQFNRATAQLQEELGMMNDMATAMRLIARLHASSAETERALGIILGWTAHSALGTPRSLKTAWKSFLDAKLFT